jgi:hypothetical protein
MPLKQLAKDQSTGMHLEGTHAIPTARHQQVWGGCMRSREGQHLHVTQSIFVHKHLGKDFVRSASTNELRTHVMTGVAMLPWETLRASSNRRLTCSWEGTRPRASDGCCRGAQGCDLVGSPADADSWYSQGYDAGLARPARAELCATTRRYSGSATGRTHPRGCTRQHAPQEWLVDIGTEIQLKPRR